MVSLINLKDSSWRLQIFTKSRNGIDSTAQEAATSITKILEIISKIEVLIFLLLTITVFKSDCCLIFYCLQWKTEFFVLCTCSVDLRRISVYYHGKMLTVKNA